MVNSALLESLRHFESRLLNRCVEHQLEGIVILKDVLTIVIRHKSDKGKISFRSDDEKDSRMGLRRRIEPIKTQRRERKEIAEK